MSKKLAQILLIEDDPEDAELTREALLQVKLRNRLHHVKDGEEAMRFLLRQGEHEEAPRPDLILLDLNLPRLDGREVLARIKEDDDLKQIPVVVLTSSNAEEDILRSYDLFANAYITKPVDLERFVNAVQSIENFWISVVSLCPA